MYAKIDSTRWTLDEPARSTVRGSDREFYHEIGCPAQGSYQDCTCYVSRIRLVKTPVGEFIPTTEPDLAPHLEYRRAFAEQMRLRAERLERQLNFAWAGMILFGASAVVLAWAAGLS